MVAPVSDGRVEQSALDTLRHSAAHVMAQAVLEQFPEAKLGIGPPIEDGFYYDFDLPRPLVPADLEAIEVAMRRIVAQDLPFCRREVSADEARDIFRDQPYKLELIDELSRDGAVISTYRQGSFEDLCRGPHVSSTGSISADALKLVKVSGAYWRGDERRPLLQRIYGTAWHDRGDVEAYLDRLQEADRRDHRRLGRDLDLYSTSEVVGSGLILWHPKGALVRMLAEEFSRKAHLRNGYQWVVSPHIGRARLWQTSGHLDYFRENMYAPIDLEGEDYYAKPVNCPFHIEIFKSRLRSYRELPLRYAEYGTVYRYERSGVLHGLTRVRGFTQDDAHIFCRPDQVVAEIDHALEFSLYVLSAFGLRDFHAYVSTRPAKAVGDASDWETATAALHHALERHAIPHELDEGGGAFYGPKIDLKVRDALGKEWQLSTVQFDFNLPERFELHYIGEDGRQHRPHMVHRALFGSVERFLGLLIEHYGGAFPLWLAPVQARVIPVSSNRHASYALSVARELQTRDFRVEVDDGKERMQAKVREAQVQKVPYMLIVGDREAAGGTVAVRLRSGEDLGDMPVSALIDRLQQEVDSHD